MTNQKIYVIIEKINALSERVSIHGVATERVTELEVTCRTGCRSSLVSGQAEHTSRLERSSPLPDTKVFAFAKTRVVPRR